MDSDKVLVMDGGQAVEFGHPNELLQNSESYFSHMVGETGPEMEKKLRNIAKNDYKLKYPIVLKAIEDKEQGDTKDKASESHNIVKEDKLKNETNETETKEELNKDL